MINADAVTRIVGAEVVDSDGRELGSVVEVYLDDITGQPEWAMVQRGLFGTGPTCVPLSEAQLMGDRLRVPYERSVLVSAPSLRPDQGHLSRSEEAELRGHFGVAAAPETGVGRADPHRGLVEEPDGAVMIRSEEQLRIGTEWVQTERVRVRKVIVTEDVTVTVTVAHEELHIERQALGTDEVAHPSSSSTPQVVDHVIVLHAERPVVTTEVVPVERVHVGTVTVTALESVSDSVRVEHIDADTYPSGGPGSRSTNS